MTSAAWLEDRFGPVSKLWEDGERVFCATSRDASDGERQACIAVLPSTEYPSTGSIERLTHEYGLRAHLEDDWAVRPLDLVRERGHTVLLLEPSTGVPLQRILDAALEMGSFLRLAIAIAQAVGRMHRRGLVHRDLKPGHILIDLEKDQVWLTGFGIASRLLRERQSPKPVELIAGTLEYMAPEQTGRMNRSIDSRSDLYSFGVVLYRMATGVLPFAASDPMEWVHSHIARKPVEPAARRAEIPAPVSAAIMKLLEKTPEERYQTALGAERDLRRCLVAWEAGSSSAVFPLGEHDLPDRLVIPERLYGREREIETLLSCFDGVVRTGRPALVLVAGYSGIGKSSVVNELHKALVSRRGLFASGKFDQQKADVPYATFAQAFQSLLRPLLGKPEPELAKWREALAEALSPNASLLFDLAPELRLIIGSQPEVVALSALDAQVRFQLAVRRFIGVFARPEHPLALFLDDLQWLDAATLDLLGTLLTAGDAQHLLLIGAYRDNEVGELHPLTRKLDALRKTKAVVQTVSLPALAPAHLEMLTADALHATPERVRPLAELVQQKTGGNPFFATQFLNSLAEEGLLAFDHGNACWSWDEAQAHAKGYSENVADLMVRKLARLPQETRHALQRLACLGNAGELGTLAVICESTPEAVDADLWPALRQELILRSESGYRFVHDRVQEAAYSLLPSSARAELHLRIGRALLLHIPPERRKDEVFAIVNQLNRGAGLITAQEDLEQLAELNLLAAERSKASSAYASALEHLKAAARALPENAWQRRRALAFSVEIARAESEFLTEDFAAAAERSSALWSRELNHVERAAVTCLRIELCVNVGQGAEALSVGLDYLRHLGVDWPERPSADDVRREYELVWKTLGDRSIEELIDQPALADATYLGMIDVLVALTTPAWLIDPHLLCLVTCRAVSLSLTHGNCDARCAVLAVLAVVAGVQFEDYQTGYRFGSLAYRLVDERGLQRFQAPTYLFFGNLVLPWTKPFRVAREVVWRAHENAKQVGNLSYATYTAERIVTSMLMMGDPLEETQRQIDRALGLAQRRDFILVVLCLVAQRGLVRSLRGLARTFGSFDDGETNEATLEAQLASNPLFVVSEFFYWVRKLQVRFFAGDYAGAVAAAAQAKRVLGPGPGSMEVADFHFYGALSLAALDDSSSEAERATRLSTLAAHQRKLAQWAAQGPQNFENRAVLVAAELARLEGRDVDAMRLYEEAIASARANDFVHNTAVSYEVAARFYLARGFDAFGRLYLRHARHAYEGWGAHGKARQLDRLYPYLEEVRPASAANTMATPIDHLDLATVLKVSETISSEIVLEKLIDALMRAAIEHAGAERGLLILAHGAEYRIEAEVTTSTEAVHVSSRRLAAEAGDLPQSIFQYVLRTRESVLLHNAAADSQFADDDYIRRRGSRSLLCLPLLKQGRLVGVLYLENNLSTDVFTPARISVLKLLASEAAISLENGRLYSDLHDREARVRRLVDSNIIGIFIAALDGQIADANDAFLRIVGYERADLVAGSLRWTELTPADWLSADARALAAVAATGVAEPYEKEYFKKDGTRVPILIGYALFNEQSNDGVAFILDLSDRKRAEEAARQSERRYHEVSMQLAHANRVATVGQLSASIAHEVNQPLTGIVNNASTCLRMLSADLPNLDGAREVAKRMIRDANRASAVIQRLRALFARADTSNESMDLNEAIREVIALSQAELRARKVVLQLSLAEDLPLVHGDRIQLQQVISNLIKNAMDSMSAQEDVLRRLQVSTSRTPSEARFTVEDSGPGIAPADHERIFEAFYSTKPGGLGVGLSICRAIIEAHGGKLSAIAGSVRGATFQFTLPLGLAPASGVSPDEAASRESA